MKNYALYQLNDGLIINTILLEDGVEYTPENGLGMVEIINPEGEWSMCSQGWSYLNGQFVEPPKPNPVANQASADQPVTTGTQTI